MKKGIVILAAVLLCLSISPAYPETSQKTGTGEAPVYSLNDLYVMGLESTEKLKIFEEDVYIAERGSDKARAALIPKASLFGTYTKYEQSGLSGAGTIHADSTTTWGARLDESLSLGGREFTAYGISKENIDKSRYGFTVAKEDYLFSIAAAYYDVLKAMKALDIARANVVRLSKQREAAAVRLRVGEVTKTAVLRAEAELSGAQSDEIKARNTLALSKISLARIVGFSGDYEVREDVTSGPPASGAVKGETVAGCVLPAADQLRLSVAERTELRNILLPVADCLKQQAASERSELKNLELQKKIAEDQVRYAKGSYWPTLSLQAVYSGREDHPSTRASDKDIYGGVSLNFPFYEGGLRKAEVLEAEAKSRQAALQYEDSKKTIYLEVDNAFLDFISQRGIIEKFSSQVAYADDNYKAVSKQFEFGLANSLDVMDANTVLVTAERQLADAEFSYRLAGARLRRVTGIFLKTAFNK